MCVFFNNGSLNNWFNLFELEKNIFKLKKYYDYDGIEYKGIRGVRNVFGLSIYEDHYESIATNVAFNSNYIEYERQNFIN